MVYYGSKVRIMLSVSKEDFLKAVYKLEEEGQLPVLLSAVARHLGISRPAVGSMRRKLEEEGLISYSRGEGVCLSANGRLLALQVIRRHRLWETFLVEVLGFPWEEVHAEAERLEHHSSDALIERMDKYLLHPRFDPHGHPIPDAGGHLPETCVLLHLAKAQKEKTYEVAQVNDLDERLVQYLGEIGLSPGKKLRLLERFDFDKSVQVKTEKGEYLLSPKVAGEIRICEA